MIKSIGKKIFGSYNDRYIKKIQPIVDEINNMEDRIKQLSDEELKAKTEEFKGRLADGADLDDILAEAFAVVREAGVRTLGMRHFDVQLVGGYVLHKGKISEMKTGEGKTLVATLALYLNALTGKGAHLVTVNDYLAQRDARWMSPLYIFLGLKVGVIQHDASFQVVTDPKAEFGTSLKKIERMEAYECDITYGTNNEYGFDYLRDNMKYEMEEFAQKHHNFAIVDEVDSILIDEARTPLIISGPTEEKTDQYYEINKCVKEFVKDEDYTLDEKGRTTQITDKGINKAEQFLGIDNLFDISQVDNLHFVNNAVKAYGVFVKDVDYVVSEGKVIIVDEFTGRLQPGRRYSDGLHQALEAKENVIIENENQTLASITFQNYFRMYDKLAGMTGTAATEAEEFRTIYGLDVVSIPTNKKMIRKDHPDVIYMTYMEKLNAVADEIEEMTKAGRPVLVGTSSIEKSEIISQLLNKKKIKHNVLNAKQHEKEAEIVADAGKKGAVTIATNMAGRGTDIKLPDSVKEAGGLHIIGAERHESRRIDNQLRGRSGRQGDPGSSRFFLSLEDDLLRIFGSDKVKAIMEKLGMKEGEPIEHSIISKSIENAQKRVEAMHFEIRKHLLDYDNVMNQQRKIVYEMRKSILDGAEVDTLLGEFIDNTLDVMYDNHVNAVDTPNVEGLQEAVKNLYDIDFEFESAGKKGMSEQVEVEVREKIMEKYKERKEYLGELFQDVTKFLLINILDAKWKEHLLHMDYLRDSVGLRGYGQKDPLNEYKKEAYGLFTDMMNRVNFDIIEFLFHVEVEENANLEIEEKNNSGIREEQRDIFSGEDSAQDKKAPVKRDQPKVGRNDPCPCGSGKKYKKCHGAGQPE